MRTCIDITPTPAQAARICRTVFRGAYDLNTDTLTAYQVLWAWKQLKHTIRRLGATGWAIPTRLVTELARWILDHADTVPSIPIDEATTYDDLITLTGS